MFSPQANFVQEGFSLDYTPVAAVAAGAVVLIGTVPLVATRDIAAGALGSLDSGGVFDIVKDSSTFADGDAVYWNTTGNPVSGTAGTGAATSTASGANIMGMVVPGGAAATGDNTVRVKISAGKRTATLGGAVTADSVTGDTSSFPVAGLAGATNTAGGAVSVTGGAGNGAFTGGAATLAGGAGGAAGGGGTVSVTGGAPASGNAAGGTASVTGGAGSGTGAGGASSVTGGASGAGATGNGGAVTLAGGAAASTNGTGGAAGLIGGLGTGTGAGGAITITSGAAGATGVAGAVNISVGAATAGNGSAVTITAGNGAGSTNSGGNINLVAGAAVSTGTPGEVQVNADSNLFFITTTLSATDASRAVAVIPRAARLKTVKYMHTTGSTSGTLQIEKLTGTTAAGSGTVLLTGTIDLSATTVANTTTSGTLIATVASITFASGDRVGIKIAGTMTNLVGAILTLGFAPC